MNMEIDAGTYGVHIFNLNNNTIYRTNIHGTKSSSQGVYIEGGSSGNLIYSNTISGGSIGVRIKYDSPNNYVISNAVRASQYDLFQGTTTTTSGCNGDVWNLNTDTNVGQASSNIECQLEDNPF